MGVLWELSTQYTESEWSEGWCLMGLPTVQYVLPGLLSSILVIIYRTSPL